MKRVIVAGAGEECPVCHSVGEEFLVVIVRDVLMAVEEAQGSPTATTDGELYVVVDP